jgi:NAD-dependent protein deacetylase/lipoamidase
MTDLARAARLVARARHVAVLTGAGVSAESGIPTFRGSGGLWQGRDPMSLATPEAFAADPRLVWEFYNWRRTLVAQAEPNPAHTALASMSHRVSRLSLITQNVDRLHQRAGSRDVLELHGNLWEVRCTSCGHSSDKTGITLPALPRCDFCDSLVRPAVVWFGEPLSDEVWQTAQAAVRAADLVLVVGTSAVVYPAAGLVISGRHSNQSVIEINLEPTPVSGAVDIGLYDKAGVILPQLVPAE